MQLKNVYEAIDALAPFALSGEYCDTYGAHDNSGIILDCGEEVTGDARYYNSNLMKHPYSSWGIG